MAKPITFTEDEAKRVARECPDQLIEIVRTYSGRTGKSSARRAVRARQQQFLIQHPDGRWSVAILEARP